MALFGLRLYHPGRALAESMCLPLLGEKEIVNGEIRASVPLPGLRHPGTPRLIIILSFLTSFELDD